jgi:hypothetical protein
MTRPACDMATYWSALINEETYFEANQDMIKVNGLEEWPELVVYLDNTFFKVDSTWHT